MTRILQIGLALLNNLLSKDDILLLVEKVRQGSGRQSLRRLTAFSGRQRVDRTWEVTESPPKHWGSLDRIQQRWNGRTTGNPALSMYQYVVAQHVQDRSGLIALSLACGTGAHEVRWAQTGRFARIEGIDISRRRIEQARLRAAAEGVKDTVHFRAGDVRNLDVREGSLDVIFAINALHHVSPLEPTVNDIRRVLKPGGVMIVRDYVGPDRFQWSPKQLTAANALLAELPPRFRVRWGSGTLKRRVFRPGRLAMWLSDPSEAPESSRILPLLNRSFDVVERKELGGAVLHLVLKDIAHHFASGDGEAREWLEYLIRREDDLMASGEVESDLVFGVWRNRP